MRKPLRGGALVNCIKLCKHCCWQVQKKKTDLRQNIPGPTCEGNADGTSELRGSRNSPLMSSGYFAGYLRTVLTILFLARRGDRSPREDGVRKKKMETRNDWKKHDGQTRKMKSWTDIYWKCTLDLEKEKTRILNYSWVYSISPNCNLRVFGLTSELHLVFVSIGINVFVLEDEETSASPFSTSFE